MGNGINFPKITKLKKIYLLHGHFNEEILSFDIKEFLDYTECYSQSDLKSLYAIKNERLDLMKKINTEGTLSFKILDKENMW